MIPATVPIPPLSTAEDEAIAVQELEFTAWRGRRTLQLLIPEGLTHPAAAVLLVPGGNFAQADIEGAAATGRALAQRLRVAVAIPAYSGACECPFPAAAEDVYAAAQWLSGEIRARGWNPAPLIVAGEGAGGNLAAAAALMARDRRTPAIAAQILVSPMLDPSLGAGATEVPASTADGLSQLQCTEGYRRYVPHAADRVHPYAAPLQCHRLAGVAPALLLTAGDDARHAECERYAGALICAGVSTQVIRLDSLRTPHGGWPEAAWTAITAFVAPHLQSRSLRQPHFRHST
jgi:acetyl esterase/lipase